MRARFSDRRRGSAAILLTMMLTFLLLPLTGLAIDGSIQYLVRTKLSAAVDASALAGARSLSKGLDLASQTAAAQLTVEKFFAANFPTGFWRTSPVDLSISIAETSLKTRSVTVSASLTSPLYFLRMLGFESTNIAVQGRASRRDVNVILVLDRSGSLTEADACDDLRAAARAFVDSFAEGRDRLGMVTFGGSSREDFVSTVNFKTASPSLSSKIGNIACNGATGSAQALSQAYNIIKDDIHEPGALNVILFFTDGQPNAITASFPVKTQTTSYSPTGKSTCLDEAGRSNTHGAWNPAPKVGFVNLATTSVRGVRNHNAPAIPVSADPNAISNASGCYFSGSSSNLTKVAQDIAYIPDTDYFGNSIWGYKSVPKYTSGPYDNKARINSTTAVENASINALDNAAARIRLDTNYAVLIYSIGLGGAEAAEHTLLQRVSNDPSSPIYNPDHPIGMYVYAPTVAQLNDAFYRIASEILRLAL
jgi:Flp pilus assembly protein TadG